MVAIPSPALMTMLTKMMTTVGVALAMMAAPSSASSVAAPASPPVSLPASLLVVAPHPDDEVLMAGGLIAAMRRAHRPVNVVIVTNGDLGCGRDGFVREDESVAALERLGVAEDDVVFLGYPDGYLAALGEQALGPVQRIDVDGACVDATTTLARRGRHGRDAHSDRTGSPGVFTAPSLVADLVAVVGRVKPAAIVVTHEIDDHPDHAAVAVFVRQALEQRGVPAVVYRSIVHLGDCWPDGSQPRGPCGSSPYQPTTAMPPLPPPFDAYLPRLRVPTSQGLPRGAVDKLDVIATYRSQTGAEPASDWLASFARLDEPFFLVELVPTARGGLARRPASRRAPGTDAALSARYRLGTPAGGALEVIVDRGEAGSAVVGVIRVGTREAAGTRRWTLQADRRSEDGGIVEVTVRRDGLFMGLVVDPGPTASAP